MFSTFYYALFSVFLILILENEAITNNECTTWTSYLFIRSSKNCYYDPDIFQQTPQILGNHVEKYENHTITTEDGYILTMFRIPNRNPKGIILLQHPVTGDGIVWVSQRNESLAFLLANKGYDVWIANNRGTYFSTEHVNKTITRRKYWDFSFHEIGLYDLSAEIRYIRTVTNKAKMAYIGHSMSVTSSLVYSSLKPEEAKESVEVFIGMSPISYFKNVRSPLKILPAFLPIVQLINNIFDFYHIFAYKGLISAVEKLCVFNPFKYICILPFLTAFGWTPNEFDPSLVCLLFSLLPRASSWKSIYHFAQEVNANGRFQMYDYGKAKNNDLYNSNIPPEYPLKNISSPFYLIYSTEDTVATVKDANLLYNSLPNDVQIYGKLEVSGLNHIDFHYGRNRIKIVYEKIFNLLDEIF